jgi:hypothetical protein
MCTRVVQSEYLQKSMTAYAVRYAKYGNGIVTYESPYFNNLSYKLKKKCVAEGKSDIITITSGSYVAVGYFHMFLSFNDAKKARKKMHPYIHSKHKHKLRYKIIKIKIYTRQRVHFGYIPVNCQNSGMLTACAKTIMHLEEVKK